MADNWMFDGEGIEFSDLARLQQIKNQEKQLQELRRLNHIRSEASVKYGTCPYCRGDLPGEYELCKWCNRNLFWGGKKAFKIASDANAFAAAEEQKLALWQKNQNDMEEAYRASYPCKLSSWRRKSAVAWCVLIVCIVFIFRVFCYGNDLDSGALGGLELLGYPVAIPAGTFVYYLMRTPPPKP